MDSPSSPALLPLELVTRCVCADVSFDQALGSGKSLAEIAEETQLGTFCGKCLPYIKKRLLLGVTP